MIKVIPFLEMTLQLSCDCDVLGQRLRAAFDSHRWSLATTGTTFEVRSRSPSVIVMPYAYVRCVERGGYTQVHFSVALPTFLYAFWGFWILATGLGALLGVGSAIEHHSYANLGLFLLPLAGWLMIALPFGGVADELALAFRNALSGVTMEGQTRA